MSMYFVFLTNIVLAILCAWLIKENVKVRTDLATKLERRGENAQVSCPRCDQHFEVKI